LAGIFDLTPVILNLLRVEIARRRDIGTINCEAGSDQKKGPEQGKS